MIIWNAPTAGSYEQVSNDGRFLLVEEADGWTEVIERENLDVIASGFIRAEVVASADKYVAPANEPVKLDEAMAIALRLARKIDLPNTDESARQIADLGDLLTRLGEAVTAHASVISARVVADQHAELSERERTDRTRAIAAASRDTVTQARTVARNARTRVAEAIVAYGTRD